MQNQIPKNWQKVNLGEVADIYLGGTPARKNSDYWDGDVKWLAIQDIVNSDGRYVRDSTETITQKGVVKSATKMLPKDTIVISARGTVGEIALLAGPMAFNQSCYGLLAKNTKKLDQIYLFYAVKDAVNRAKQLAHGGVFDTFTKETFNHIEIRAPKDVSEQKLIVSIISAFDDKIEVNNKIAKTLEEMAQVIFKEWFVTNKKDSWLEKNLEDVCETYGGGTPSTKEVSYWQDGTIYWATPTDMTALKGPFIFQTEKRITESGLKKSSAMLLPKDTVLITSRATVGILAISKAPMSTNQGFISVVCKNPLSTLFMYCWLKRNVRLIQGLATGSTFPEISRGVFRKIKITIPDRETLEKFGETIEPMFEKIANIIQENQKLASMRDLLLPKLMTGEIRV